MEGIADYWLEKQNVLYRFKENKYSCMRPIWWMLVPNLFLKVDWPIRIHKINGYEPIFWGNKFSSAKEDGKTTTFLNL